MEHGIAMEPMKGKWLHLELTWGIPSYFILLTLQQCSSCLVTVFLGTLWCSIKHIEAHYVFDWEHGIALHPVQGIRALIPGEWDDSWDLPSCTRNLGYILELQRGWTFEFHFVELNQDSCLVRTDTSGS